MKILNFGSLNIDYVYQVDHMVRPGETLASLKRDIHCGGKGLNQSLALSKAGGSVWHAGLIGGDGLFLKELLERGGVHTEWIRVIPESTGHTVIQVDRTGQNSILLYGGANQRITESYADEVLAQFGSGDILILQNEICCLPYIMENAGKKGMRIVLNPSPLSEQLERCDMNLVSLFVLNETEGRQLTGGKSPEEILDELGTRFPKAAAVLTLGREGSVWQYGGERVKQEAFSVRAVDTTGAGDTFTGYLTAMLAEGKPVRAAMRAAAMAAAISVTRPGAAASIPERQEVEAALV
ncbi:MAG: ribokinase [Lachnospiraceae bacterium]